MQESSTGSAQMFSPASVGGAQAGESHHRDAFGAAEVDQLLLVQVRVALDLQEC